MEHATCMLWRHADVGHVHSAYNSFFSACFFRQNNIFLSQQISQQCFSAGSSAQLNVSFVLSSREARQLVHSTQLPPTSPLSLCLPCSVLAFRTSWMGSGRCMWFICNSMQCKWTEYATFCHLCAHVRPRQLHFPARFNGPTDSGLDRRRPYQLLNDWSNLTVWFLSGSLVFGVWFVSPHPQMGWYTPPEHARWRRKVVVVAFRSRERIIRVCLVSEIFCEMLL
jgi:hypothetical protein